MPTHCLEEPVLINRSLPNAIKPHPERVIVTPRHRFAASLTQRVEILEEHVCIIPYLALANQDTLQFPILQIRVQQIILAAKTVAPYWEEYVNMHRSRARANQDMLKSQAQPVLAPLWVLVMRAVRQNQPAQQPQESVNLNKLAQ